MKYKVGDRVKIKSIEQLAKIYQMSPHREGYLNRYHPNRVLEIDSTVGEYCYRVKGSGYNWMDEMIEGYACICLSYNERTGEHVEDCPLYTPSNKIKNRWEILDLRGKNE